MEKLTHFMSIIKKQCHSFMTESLKAFDISGAEAPFIKYISENPNCRQTDLSKAFECDKAHCHRIVARLIEKKMVSTCTPCTTFKLTEKGHSLVEIIKNAIKKWTQNLFDGITKEEEEVALNILQKIASNACKFKMETKND